MAAPMKESGILWLAVKSRFILLSMQFIFNICIPDHNPDVFNPPIIDKNNETFLDTAANILLGGLVRWDAIYFLHIAEHGYTYENCLAFFPLYPLVVRLLGSGIFLFLQSLMTYRSVLVITAIVLNQVLFVKAVTVLYRLGQKLLHDDNLAYIAASLFCINPASVFMSAPYSEILFAFLVFTGMLRFEKNLKVTSSFMFGLSASTRSNGILYTGLEIHKKLKNIISQFTLMFEMKFTGNRSSFIAILFTLFVIVISGMFYVLLGVLPFFVYQYYSYQWFCVDTSSSLPESIKEYGWTRGYHLKGDSFSIWCNNTLPVAYSYIQKSHWNVGFLNYFKIKQIPNFLLAAPVTVMSISAVVVYFRLNKETVLTLDLIPEDITVAKKKDRPVKEDWSFENRKLLPYVIHFLFLLVFGWFFTHIQIITRMLFSSSPLLYWYAAYVMTMGTSKRSKVNKWDVVGNWHKNQDLNLQTENFSWTFFTRPTDKNHFYKTLILLYFIGYFVIGTLLFSNFLPWT